MAAHTYELINDEPTVEDALGRESLVKRVADTMLASKPPLVFGVHGDWGAGKTSFLHQLQWYLTGECPQNPTAVGKPDKIEAYKPWAPARDVTVVWFEAWRYQYEKAPIVALLQEIRTQLPWVSKAFTRLKKTAEVTIRGALLSMEDLTKKIGIQASKIEKAGKEWEQENLASALPSHTIRKHLEGTLRALLPKKGRLVVLIDDLDRCEAECAFRLLEGVKIYLNIPNCFFVLGMNQRIIEAAIAKSLPHDEGEKEKSEREWRSREYLEKICQTIWHLPNVVDHAPLLERWLPQDCLARETIIGLVGTFNCLPPNPRKTKAFANVFSRFYEHAEEHVLVPDKTEEQRVVPLLILVAYVHLFFPEIYRRIEENPRFIEKVCEWANEGFSDHALRPRINKMNNSSCRRGALV